MGRYAPRMRERGLEYKVGLLILISTAILIGFIFVLGNFSLRSGFSIYVDRSTVDHEISVATVENVILPALPTSRRATPWR